MQTLTTQSHLYVLSNIANHRYFKIASYVVFAVFTVVLLAILSQAFALTATTTAITGAASTTNSGGILSKPVIWILNFMAGTGGLLAAVLALLWTLYEAFVKKSMVGVMMAVGVALIALYGPAVLLQFFGASL